MLRGLFLTPVLLAQWCRCCALLNPIVSMSTLQALHAWMFLWRFLAMSVCGTGETDPWTCPQRLMAIPHAVQSPCDSHCEASSSCLYQRGNDVRAGSCSILVLLVLPQAVPGPRVSVQMYLRAA